MVGKSGLLSNEQIEIAVSKFELRERPADQVATRLIAESMLTRYQAERLLSGLMRHLDDEEDLIVPMLIDRHEDGKPLM